MASQGWRHILESTGVYGLLHEGMSHPMGGEWNGTCMGLPLHAAHSSYRSQGMYPTAIILLVALNKSHFEGTTRGDIATPHMSFRRPTSSQDSSNSDEGSDSPCRRSVGGLGQPGLNSPWNSVESTVVMQRSVDGRVEESTNAEGKRNYAILPISHPIPTRPHSVS